MDFSKLLGQLDSVTTKKYDNDDKNALEFWKMTRDKAGNASALIHFLPNKTIEDFPFVRLWTHAFKNKVNDKDRWYIENSLSTIGEVDYIGEVNRELYNSGVEENKKIAQNQKRKLNYISNILVIKDTGNPENNGKVFKFKYGQKIFDKIVAAAKPDVAEDGLEDEPATPINAFDPISGADFLIKQSVVANFPNYDASKFSSQKPMCGGDEDKIQEVLAQCYDLSLEVAPDRFKSYEELKKKFLWVMGQEAPRTGQGKAQSKSKVDDTEDELDALAALAKEEPKKEKVKAEPKVEKKSPPLPVATDDGDDDDAYFASLLSED
jgi:gp32 DNA binding protein like